MKKEKIYIAGPMTGIAEFNHPKFLEWEAHLETDCDVLNPARIDGGLTNKPREFYVREAFKLLCQADKIFLLKGWEDSDGALKEVLMAEEMGLKFSMELETMRSSFMTAQEFMQNHWPRYVDRESLSSHINKIEKEYYGGFGGINAISPKKFKHPDLSGIDDEIERTKEMLTEELQRNKEADAAERKHMAEFYETVAHTFGGETKKHPYVPGLDDKIDNTKERAEFYARKNAHIFGDKLEHPSTLPTDPAERKRIPVYSGFVNYFPLAMAAVAKLSYEGSEQHHPGKPLHWDRSKSVDELDALMRHLIEGEWTQVAWRAMANLQKQLEKEGQNDA